MLCRPFLSLTCPVEGAQFSTAFRTAKCISESAYDDRSHPLDRLNEMRGAILGNIAQSTSSSKEG